MNEEIKIILAAIEKTIPSSGYPNKNYTMEKLSHWVRDSSNFSSGDMAEIIYALIHYINTKETK